MTSFFEKVSALGSSPTFNIQFSDESIRPKKSFRGEAVDLPLYNGNETITGKVDVVIPSGKKFEHLGIKIEMIGHIGKLLFLNVFKLVALLIY